MKLREEKRAKGRKNTKCVARNKKIYRARLIANK